MKETEEKSPDTGTNLQRDFWKFIQDAIRDWKMILIWALIGAAFGVMIGLSTPRTYVSEAVVAPEIMTRSTLGGISSLASLAGINTNTMALTDAMHPDMYPEIIHSSNFFLDLFDMPVTVETKDSLVHTDLYDYMAHYNKAPWWGYVLGAPKIALNLVKSLFIKKAETEEAEGYAVVDSLRLTKQQEGVIKSLSKSVNANVNKRTYVLSLKVKTQDPVISAQLANATVENLQKFVTTYRTEKARENVDYFQKIYDETKANYLSAQRALTYYLDTHQGNVTRSSQAYAAQLQNEANLRYQMYNQTAQNLLTAQAKVQQEAPVLVVIQPGIAPHIGQPSRVRIVILWFLIGVALRVGWKAFGFDKIFKKKEKEIPAEA